MNQNTESKLDDRLASFVLAFCIVVMMTGVIAIGYNALVRGPQTITMHIETGDIQSDKELIQMSQEQFDSLFTIIGRQEEKFSEKYQYLLEREDDEDKFFSIGAMVIGVVFSICGFFGYKSLKSIEERATDNAKNIAEKEVATYMESNLKGTLVQESHEYFESNAANVLKEKILAEIRSTDYIKTLVNEYLESTLIVDFQKSSSPKENQRSEDEEQIKEYSDDTQMFEKRKEA